MQKRVSSIRGEGFGYGFATMENPAWTLADILRACNGRLVSGIAHAAFRSVSTDTRNLRPGDVFLALRGDHFDGSHFVEEAVRKGAACVITDTPPEISLPIPLVVVQDSLWALGALAQYRRKLVSDLKVIGITGSSGKTTVKEMTATILEKCGRVLKTHGNFNNLVGLPLSLLPVNYRHHYAVLEMGMNQPGEIARLAEISQPDIACILNIQHAHIQGLGSVEKVAQAKGELFDHCSSKTTLVVNRDDHRVVGLIRGKKAKVLSFGRHKEADVRATRILSQGTKGLGYTLHIGDLKSRVHLQLCGKHNVWNSLAAAAIATALGVTLSDIVAGLEGCQPSQKRFEISQGMSGSIVINDTYNANPASMRAAIETTSSLRKGGKAVAVLGDMLELGNYSKQAHREVGEMVARNDFTYLFALGGYGKELVAGALHAGMPKNKVGFYKEQKELFSAVRTLFEEQEFGVGDIFLFKGSRGMRMETLCEQVMDL